MTYECVCIPVGILVRYQCRHVHVENHRKHTRFEVRTQMPSLTVYGIPYIMVYIIYTQRLNNINTYTVGLVATQYYSSIKGMTVYL